MPRKPAVRNILRFPGLFNNKIVKKSQETSDISLGLENQQ